MAKTMSTLFVALAALAAAVSARAVPPTSPTSAVGPSDLAEPPMAVREIKDADRKRMLFPSAPADMEPNLVCAYEAALLVQRRAEESALDGVVTAKKRGHKKKPEPTEEPVLLIADLVDCE